MTVTTAKPPERCTYCRQPLSDHVVELHQGVPVVGARRSDGTMKWCSLAHADVQYMEGRIVTLQTLVRSLRWRATRNFHLDLDDPSAYLDAWSDKVAAQIRSLQYQMARWR